HDALPILPVRHRSAMIEAIGERGADGVPGPALIQSRKILLSLSTLHPSSQWRIALLAAAVALIVVVPFLLVRQAARTSDDAWTAVLHTQQVESAVHELASSVRSVEAGALSLAAGVDNPTLR